MLGKDSNAVVALRAATLWLTYGSAVSILFSIALSQVLLGLALAALFASGEKLAFPPVRLPLALLFLDTVAALLLSGDPLHGTPQIRKFFIFAIMLVIYSAFRTVAQVRRLVLLWSGAAAVSAALGLMQFLHRRQEAFEQHADNYGFYLDNRITGFAGHWMTFGGEQMIVVLMLAAFLLFARWSGWKLYGGWVCLPLLCGAIVIGLTRSIFLLGLPAGMLYLLWSRNRFLPLAAAVIAVVGLWVAPGQVRERVISVARPHGEVDSNTHRYVTRRAGWEMVKAHPWFGVGPEQIGPQFDRYIPADIHRPLPNGWYGHLHNIYLQYAAERGIPGLLLVMWLIGKMLWDFVRALRIRPGAESEAVLHGAVAVILAILAEGFFEYNLGDSEVLTMFLAVTTSAYVVANEIDRQHSGSLCPETLR